MSASTNMVKSPSFLPAPKRAARQHRLLAQHVTLEEVGIPRLITTAIFAVAAIVSGFVAWAASTRIDEVAISPGEVVPAGEIQQIQHLEGGIVSAILVHDGDLVERGDTLVRLDPISSSAGLQELRAQRIGLMLKAERLRAFADERAPDFSFAEPEYARLVEDQRGIHQVQENARANRRKVIVNQINKDESQLKLLRSQKHVLKQIMAFADDELAMRKTLLEKGLTSKLKLLDAQRRAARAYGDFNKLQGEIQLAVKALAESRSRLPELDATIAEEAISKLDAVTRHLAQLRQTLNKTESQVGRLEIKAPVRGIVKGLRAHTVGGVVPPGNVVLELVPMDKEMIVEARVSTRDVGHLKKGQPVTVKVATYDYARYGGISGELEGVSASTFLAENGKPFYKAVVKLARNYVGSDPKRNHVLPGMTIEADIKTGRKTLLQYLLKPVYAYTNSAFHER